MWGALENTSHRNVTWMHTWMSEWMQGKLKRMRKFVLFSSEDKAGDHGRINKIPDYSWGKKNIYKT